MGESKVRWVRVRSGGECKVRWGSVRSGGGE